MMRSLDTVQRNLARRDSQTQELHRQLRITEQECIRNKMEANYSRKRLQDLLSDPSLAPQFQAQELGQLRQTIDDLSTRLADSRSSETTWSKIAKRQRAFFMQSELVAQEGVNLFRKHPAGELFLAPPPDRVYLEDDDIDVSYDTRKPPWDVGTHHINPYATDSWPFEPNACSQRCAAEPNLSRWDEEDAALETDSEDGFSADNSEDQHRSHLMLRLPQLPPDSPPDQDFDPPEPMEPPEPLPTGGMTTRSA